MVEARAERLALQEFRDHVGRALELAYMEDGHDVGVVQGCGSLRFVFEAAQTFRVARPVVGKDLDGDLTLKGQVAGAKDLSHAAGAQVPEDLVGVESRSGNKGHGAKDYMPGCEER